MRLIVDANIVFSGILNSKGKIGDLLINGGKAFHFIAPDFLRIEIHEKYPRLMSISGMSEAEVREAEFRICREITFVSEEQIRQASWKSAKDLVMDIDPGDIQYVAFAKHFRCKLWSGDKQLMQGLRKKGFQNVITTEELYGLWLQKKN